MNIHDIAREAGVSTATVSRVINNKDVVQDATRSRVLEVIGRYGYTPNALARGLLRNRTGLVGVLTVDIQNPYYAAVVQSVEERLNQNEYNTFLCNTGGSHEQIVRYMQALLENRVDGLVLVGSVYRERDGNAHILAAAAKVPVLLINSYIRAPNVYSLLCDDRKGIMQAVDYLRRTGRHSFLFVNTTETFSAGIKERQFRKMMASAPFKGCDWSVMETDTAHLDELSVKVSEAYLEKQFDAILATDDLFASAAIAGLHRIKISIPDTVAVVGYNSSSVCSHTYPALTSVDSRMQDLGALCADSLHRLLCAEAPQKSVTYLEPSLVVRESA
ncbi:LacI family DNA-binding transcriptional regulator [Salinispira pacifica]